MNILHLYSDWRWTGPADPVLNICKALQERGHNVVFAYRKPTHDVSETIERFTRERKINSTDIFKLNRYFNISDNVQDIVALRRFIFEKNIDIVNTHLSHDHVIGSIACRLASNKAVLIRTDHNRDPFTLTVGNRFLLKHLTDGIITFSGKTKERLTEEFGIAENNVIRIMPAVDSNVFNTNRQYRAMRKIFGIDDNDIVVGIVTRFQKYRKMDMFFDALSSVITKMPNVKALLLGTSSKMKETVYEPVKRLNLEKNVVIAGYLSDDYIDALACMDIFVFLIAGSDGTGRAMREVMAMGKPVIANNTGMLPEMIDEGKNGFIFDNSAATLSNMILELCNDKTLRLSIGKAARTKAELDFSIDRQAADIETFYEHQLRLKKQR